ncbi:MAG TPA: PQQ-binding-like beta-propeller repeat protein, partial [Gemmataceae bacterium]
MSRRLTAAVCLVVFASPAAADDWPQWRGPNRDGVSKETGLLRQWPEGGPKLLWKVTDLGTGYSTPSVSGGRVFLISSRGLDEFCQALDEQSGEKVWEVKIGAVGNPKQQPPYPGSRSTPTVDGELLYALSSAGDLVCLEAATGKERWRRSYTGDFGGVMGEWAFSESPLVDGDLLIGTPGGKEATLVALNKKTGEVVWKSPIGDVAGYASPIAVRVGGRKQYVQFLHDGVVGVDADSGKFSWRYARTADKQANMMTPVFHDGFVFSAAGRTGGGLIRLVAKGGGVEVEEVYFSPRTMAVSMGGAVRVGDHLYGTGGRGDLGCVEFRTGKQRWSDPCVGGASICAADGHLYVRGHRDGTVALVEATPDGYREKGRLKQPERGDKPAWPHPVV